MKDLMAGLAILAKYNADASVCAEHDIIYVLVEKDVVSAPDKNMLEAISGWHWSESSGSWGFFT